MAASAEQQRAIDAAVREGRHVVCEAPPGSGKTFTAMRVAEGLLADGRTPMAILYNRDVKEEWRAKLGVLAHNYHSLGRVMYGIGGMPTDDDLRRGAPTNHIVFGDGMAILAGDGLLTEAFAVMVRPIAAATSAIRTEKAHSLSYHASTRTSLFPTTFV